MIMSNNGTKTFEVSFIHNDCSDGGIVDSAFIEIDDRVIAAVNDEWRSSFYNLFTPAEIAAHICYNMVVNRLQLSNMDGFANLFNSYAVVKTWPDLDNWDTVAIEVSSS